MPFLFVPAVILVIIPLITVYSILMNINSLVLVLVAVYVINSVVLISSVMTSLKLTGTAVRMNVPMVITVILSL